MDSTRFDHLTIRLQRGQIGRRRFLLSAIALGIGIPGFRVGLAARGGESGATLALQRNNASHLIGQNQTTPFDPSEWFCWPGPGPTFPWFPVVPDTDAVLGTRVRWYGLHIDESDLLTMASFGSDGQEVSRCETWREPDGAVRLRFADAATRVEGRIVVERDAAGVVRVAGERNGQPVDTDADAGAQPVEDPAQRELLDDWAPMTHELDGLLDVMTTVGDDTATAGGAKCAAAGYLAGLNCLALVGGLGLFGVGKCVDDAESLYDYGCA